MTTIRVLLVDDHQVVREGLRRMLELEKDVEVVGEAANVEETLALVESLVPDIVLMDVKMPGVDGVELTRRLKEKQPTCNVIMLTLYGEYLVEALQAGAAGYLLKDIKREELAYAIRRVFYGEQVICESLIAVPAGSEEESQCPPQEGDDSDTSATVQEVELIIPSPTDASQLAKFTGQLQATLHSEILEMVGSWDKGISLTIQLLDPTPLLEALDMVKGLPEVAEAREGPSTGHWLPSFLRKIAAVGGSRSRSRKKILITLRTG